MTLWWTFVRVKEKDRYLMQIFIYFVSSFAHQFMIMFIWRVLHLSTSIIMKTVIEHLVYINGDI